MLLLSLLLLTPPSQAEEVEPSGVVDAVVVFPDRASVTRVLQVDLAEGLNEVRFEDLPPTLDEQTLQAEGRGMPGAALLGLDVVSRELVEDRRSRVADLESRIQALRDELQVLRDRQAAAGQELSFLQNLRAASATQLSAELLFADETVAKAEALASLLRARVPEVQAMTREAAVAERELQDQIDALARELATVQGAAQWSRRDVTVQVSAPEAGQGEVALTYLLPGASWKPHYDVRADLEEGAVDLGLSGVVTQTTGEDWSAVGLTLSTARPASGVAPPELQPFWLQSGYIAPRQAYYVDDVMDDGEVLYAEAERARPAPKPSAPPAEPMAVVSATVTERAVASTFEVPGRSGIPGDGTRRKLLVTEAELPLEFVHVVVPRLEETAFLVATGTWDGAWPLLGGRVSTFLDGAFVGTSDLDAVGPGGELRLGFGRDDGVRVEVELVEEQTSKPDWMGKITYRGTWRYQVVNGRDHPVQVELTDRVPVSKEVKYVVRYTGDEPDELTADGLATFSRELGPGDEMVVEFGYLVRYPRRSPPWGLP